MKAGTGGHGSVFTASPLPSNVSKPRKRAAKRSRGARQGSFNGSTIVSDSDEQSEARDSVGPEGPSSIHGGEDWVNYNNQSRAYSPAVVPMREPTQAVVNSDAGNWVWIQVSSEGGYAYVKLGLALAGCFAYDGSGGCAV
jgi:hypothetical protein